MPIGPKAVEQTGEIADGWLPFLLNPREPELLMDGLRTRAAERAGRSLSEIDIAPVVPVAVHDDLERGPPPVAAVAGLLPRRHGRARTRTSTSSSPAATGTGSPAIACQEAMLAGDRMGAAMALTDELIDAAWRSARRRRDSTTRLAAYEAAGANTLVAIPAGDKAAAVRALAAAVGAPGG